MDISDYSLSELKERLYAKSASNSIKLLRALDLDRRAGARALAKGFRGRARHEQFETDRLEKMLVHEKVLLEQGYKLIAGADEVGRGALAGPLVAAAVVLEPGATIPGVRDSKKLTAQTRERLAKEISDAAVAWAVAEVSNREIDRLGLQPANLMALRLAVEGLEVRPDFVLSDGFMIKSLKVPSAAIVRGDSASITIAAASILAKVHRDGLMEAASRTHSLYYFESNKGYGSHDHLEALKRHGACPIHRRSFSLGTDTVHQTSLSIEPVGGKNDFVLE